MPYSRLERGVAALLDAAPGVRRFAKAGYQRINYLVHGLRGERVRLHPGASIERIPEAAHANGRDRSHESFFGYFGVSPWSRNGDNHVFHQWHAGSRTVDICVYDRRDATARVLASSSTWNFQQGSMTQWLNAAGSAESVIFNDCVDRQLVCRILRLDGRERTIAWPIQSIHPLGTQALSINYRRLWRVQPEYGYGVAADNFSADQPADRDGIWLVDLGAGEARLILSLGALQEHAVRPDMRGAAHQVNHAVYSPRGDRLAFMHRWMGPLGKFSRLYCASSDGSALRLLLDHRMVSHYAWRDESTLLAWARTPEHGDRYYLIDVATGAREVCCADSLDRFGDGHPSFSPDGRWIVTDSYPDRARMRRLLLCCRATGQVIEVGAFHSPWRYEGATRCDLHPRWSPDCRFLSIDSTHEGVRRTYSVDVGRIAV